MSFVYLTEKKLRNQVTGKNKAFITRTINAQKKKYGNTNIFSCVISTHEKEIRFSLGESQGIFKQDYRTGKWEREYGNLYQADKCTEIVNELAEKIGM